MSNRKIIITIGSSRHSRNFEFSIPLKSKYKVCHISDEDKFGNAKSSKTILEEIMLVSEKEVPCGVISFARSTVIGSVENVAESLEKLNGEGIFKGCKLIGPSFIAAKTLSNKWLSAKSMKRHGFSVLRTVNVNNLNLKDVYKKLESGLFPLPAVLKATYLSGGAGMRFIRKARDLIPQYNFQKKQEITESILTEFLIGPEASVEMLYLGDHIFVFPMSIKDPTNESLDHGDNKVKIAGYLRPLDKIQAEAVDIAKKYKASGYFAIEGIVYDLSKRQWKIMEGTPRFTGSYPMFNATLPHFDSMRAIFNFIDDRKWIPSLKTKQQIVIQIPVFMSSVSMAKKSVDKLKQFEWIVFARVENLSELPFSVDNRIRIQVTFKAGINSDWLKRIHVMQGILDDKTMERRIASSIKRLDEYFPDLVYKKDILKNV